MENEICECILNLYNSLPKNGKPLINQYTILSGIVAQIIIPSSSSSSSNSSSSNYLLLPICLCTGTKCLSNNSPGYQQGITLSDLHSEVLVRRCFLRYLLLISIEILKNQNLSNEITCPLIIIETNKGIKFKLKDNWNLWLYISDNPCGSASIYERISPERSFTGKKLRGVEQFDHYQNQNQNQNQNQIEEDHKDDNIQESNNNNNLQQLLKSKPGRIDIQDCRRSSSMSCSDKICRWSCLGIQGALLSKFLESPIYLTGLVISQDMAGNGQSMALERSITNRLIQSFQTKNENSQLLIDPVIPQIYLTPLQYESGKCYLENLSYQQTSQEQQQNITLNDNIDNNESNNNNNNNNIDQISDRNDSINSNEKSFKKKRNFNDSKNNPYINCANLKSCSTNINWIRNFGSESRRDLKKVQSQGGTLEVTLANTGRPQGTTKISTSTSTKLIESRLCRNAIGKLCLELDLLIQKHNSTLSISSTFKQFQQYLQQQTVQKNRKEENKEEEESNINDDDDDDDDKISVLYSDYKKFDTEYYYQIKRIFLENNSFKGWEVDDPELTENFNITIDLSSI